MVRVVLRAPLAVPFVNHAATPALVERLALTGPAWLLVTCERRCDSLAFPIYVGHAATLHPTR